MRVPALRAVRFLFGILTMVLGAVFGLPIFAAVLTVEAPVTMWDKVDTRLAGATPCAQMLFRSFKSWTMQHLRGINLQLLDVSDLTAFTNPLDGAVRVYAIYLKKQGTATASFFKIFDDATNDATLSAARVDIALMEAGKENFVFFPDGLPLANGVVLGAFTAFIGGATVTASTTGDGPNGFLLVG